MRKIKATVGERWGTRVIIETDLPRIDQHPRVKVRCDCGKEQDVAYSTLRYGFGCKPCAAVLRFYDSRETQAKIKAEREEANRVRVAANRLRNQAVMTERRGDRRTTIQTMLDQGMRRVDVARALDLSPSMITKIMKGER